MIIAGTPYLQTFIPNQAPMLPPSTAKPNNAVSLMRHLEFLAFLRPVGSKRPEVERHLSIPYMKKVAMLMATR